MLDRLTSTSSTTRCTRRDKRFDSASHADVPRMFRGVATTADALEAAMGLNGIL